MTPALFVWTVAAKVHFKKQQSYSAASTRISALDPSIAVMPSLSNSARSRVAPGFGVVSSFVADEDRVGAGEEAQRLRLLAHVLAPGREPHHRLAAS